MLTEFRVLLTVSFLLAVTNLLLPIVGHDMTIVYPLTAAWLSLLVLAVMTYGKRGLWLLIGSPLALFWALIAVAYSFGYIDL
jgi:hypothetical protein